MQKLKILIEKLQYIVIPKLYRQRDIPKAAAVTHFSNPLLRTRPMEYIQKFLSSLNSNHKFLLGSISSQNNSKKFHFSSPRTHERVSFAGVRRHSLHNLVQGNRWCRLLFATATVEVRSPFVRSSNLVYIRVVFV